MFIKLQQHISVMKLLFLIDIFFMLFSPFFFLSFPTKFVGLIGL